LKDGQHNQDREVHKEEQFQSVANQDASSVEGTGHLGTTLQQILQPRSILSGATRRKGSLADSSVSLR